MSDYGNQASAASTPMPNKGIEHIDQSISSLMDAMNMAEGIADRIAGALAETNASTKSALTAVPSSARAILHDHAERIQMAANHIRAAVNRIDDAI